jgi:hypothetical protein
MANLSRNFIKGRMNKSVDERLLPDGEYIDALNIRLGSTEESEIGIVENAKGNTKLTELVDLLDPSLPRLDEEETFCIGSFADDTNQTIYWFVHCQGLASSPTGVMDLIVSYNESTSVMNYHVISTSTLNFSKDYLINGIDLIDGLLFFTDNFNPPRFINVKRNYEYPDASTYVDPAILEEQLLVVKKPPLSPPPISLLRTSDNENFLDDRFVCFAYRYRYSDGEYSATSPFSEPAFSSRPFAFDLEDFLNEGASNAYNVAEITYNTGGELVIGIDILFKNISDGTIKVIEKIDKAERNLVDNSDEVYRFDKSKIYTILPESEILRLYDNVPLLAKAQTLMGNRLMYGNYVEGNDMVDSSGLPVYVDYRIDLVSDFINNTSIAGTRSSSDYNLVDRTSGPCSGSGTNPVSVPNSEVSFDLGTSNIPNPGQNLRVGATLEFSFFIQHEKWDVCFGGGGGTPDNVTPTFELTFTYTLTKNYPSAAALIQDPVFKAAIGEGTAEPAPDGCDGDTMTDLFNCLTADSVQESGKVANKDRSAIDAISGNEPIAITTPAGSNILSFQFPATYYQHGPSDLSFEYYSCSSASCAFVGGEGGKSLHSNRDYSVGMIYMDDYGRQSTVFTSDQNTVHVPCSNSILSNKVKFTIPSSQNPPSWATHYKFAIRSNKEFYETIYSNLYFLDTQENEGYLFLEGENARKVEDGDVLIVKADGGGSSQRCSEVTILEKRDRTPNNDPITDTYPDGVYIKVSANELILNFNSSDIIKKSAREAGRVWGSTLQSDMSIQDGGVIPLEAGDRIRWRAYALRHGTDTCSERSYEFDEEFVVPRPYPSVYDWFVGEDIQTLMINSGDYYGTSTKIRFSSTDIGTDNKSSTYAVFFIDSSSFKLTTFRSCSSSFALKGVVAETSMTITKASGLVVFETKPVDTNPDIFYEGNETFTITGGVHDTATATLSFFDCFAFGNGIESYKIKDSVTGDRLALGNRVTSVASEDYKRAERVSDITYSGVFNDESNVNKLNEFNLGLLNFKRLEEIYGPITVLDGRETDVLALQEDKVSYVLAGKNLLSDAAAGGAITSVPEVLGTQIARVEEYGNSFNAESYVQWGDAKYFTDAKRGAVIMLKGSGQSESLSVISELGMRSWFRDLFIGGLKTQKLGAFDPYMNEYVLASNDNELPSEEDCVGCNSNLSNIILGQAGGLTTYTFCVDFTGSLGASIIYWDTGTTPDGNVTMRVESGTDDVTRGVIAGGASSGNFSLVKTDASTKTATVTLTHTSGEPVTFKSFSVGCLTGNVKTIVSIVLSDGVDVGKTIHAQYSYGAFGRNTFLTTFELNQGNPNRSLFNSFAGAQGLSNVPTDGSTITMYANEFVGDTYDVQASVNKFRYLSSNTAYTNGSASLQLLIDATDAAGNVVAMTGVGPEYSTSFTMPTDGNQYFYMIWDFRNPTAIDLCLDASVAADACCNCACTSAQNTQYEIDVLSGLAIVDYVDATLGSITQAFNVGITAFCVAAGSPTPVIVSGDASLSIDIDACGCAPATPIIALNQYYIDGDDFSRASVISTNSDLDNPPSAGWYSDGNIARFCDGLTTTLGPISVCPNCP